MEDCSSPVGRLLPDPLAQAAARAAVDEMRTPAALIETVSIPRITPSGAERFLAKLAFPESADDCRHWTAALDADGYGKFGIGDKTYRAHRVAFAWMHGAIPIGFTIDHACHGWDDSCDGGIGCLHRRCQHPGHLEAKPSRENILAGNTLAADNRDRDFCPRSHELVGTNLKPRALRRAGRECRICDIIGVRARMGARDRGGSVQDQNAAGRAAIDALTGAETVDSLGLGPDSIHFALELVESHLRFDLESGGSE